VPWQYGHSKRFSPAVGLSWPRSILRHWNHSQTLKCGRM
jgi:hypothetical protein